MHTTGTNYMGGITVASSFLLDCSDSQGEYIATKKNYTSWSLGMNIISVEAESDDHRGYPIDGYASWADNSVHQCRLKWKGIVAAKTNANISGFGFGLGFTDETGLEEQNTLVFNMTKSTTCTVDCSPLVLDLENDGFHLGESGTGIYYDMTGNGQTTKMQWVKLGGDEAFLALDLNKNGVIDNGTELFGVGTRIILDDNALAANGFVGLSQYDDVEMGGNNDGIISKDDEVWDSLLLWLDSNANGISEINEIKKLKSQGFKSLGTIPESYEHWDPQGNYLPLWSYASKKITGQNLENIPVVDVFFKTLD